MNSYLDSSNVKNEEDLYEFVKKVPIEHINKIIEEYEEVYFIYVARKNARVNFKNFRLKLIEMKKNGEFENEQKSRK